MNKQKSVQATEDKSEYPDQFMQALRQTLEHIDDTDWLQTHAPFATIYFTGANATVGRTPQIALTGQKELDNQLRAIWHDWETRPHTPLQRLIWEAVCKLPPLKEPNYQALLLLTYFQLAKPKQSDVIKTLAISRATYYRYLDQAIVQLGDLVIQLLRPALRLESPAVRPLIGRTALLEKALQRLQDGAVLHFIGGSGLGKTSLGVHLAERWGRSRTFWYTFRPAVSDHVDQLLFVLGYFLHQQGASNLWLQLTVNPKELSVHKALTTIRQSLEELNEKPPLFCFDEVDLLLPDDRHETDRYAQLRALLEEVAQSPRQGAPMLLIGQKLLLEPDPDYCFVMPRFTKDDADAFLNVAGIQLGAEELERLLAYTRGNPLLLRLFIIWQRLTGKESDALQQLATGVSFDWLWARLRQHLASKEEQLLQELSVHQGVAPRAFWRKQQKTLEKLITLNLVDTHEPDGVSLHPTFRAALYRALPVEQRRTLHLNAALAYDQRAEFTTAAYHYIQGTRPEMAVWTWYNHQTTEIQQGQAGAALALFAPLAQTPLPHPADQKVLSLLLANLYSLAGQAQAGLHVLDQVAWTPQQPTTALAHEVRGHLLSHQGEIDQALEEYRHSIDLVTQLRADHTINLLTTIGRHQLIYLRDVENARSAARQAQYEVAVLQGEIESTIGNYQGACRHYQTALALAETIGNPYTLAKLYEAIGILHTYHEQVEEAIYHLERAGEYYRAYGNEICAVGVTKTNTAYAYLLARRYAEAVPPAKAAITFFTKLQEPYWLALNETNLAEAHFYLGNLALAEDYAERALRQEEAVVRPYCFYILGHIRRVQGQFPLAEQLCRQAITGAEENSDPWALGPVWRALGETYRDWGKSDSARIAFQELLALYQRLGVEAEIAWSRQLLATV